MREERKTKFGVQPARAELARQGWTISAAAERLGENRGHLNSAMLGRTTPCDRLRERLPKLLGRPLNELFTAESLAARYGGKNRYSTTEVPVTRRFYKKPSIDMSTEDNNVSGFDA